MNDWQYQHDKIKRKALIAPNTVASENQVGFSGTNNINMERPSPSDHQIQPRSFGANLGNTVNIGAIVGGMEASGVKPHRISFILFRSLTRINP